MLIVVKVSRVILNKIIFIGKFRLSMGWYKDLDLMVIVVSRMVINGCNINLMYRLFVVKLYNKIFEGGWREDGFWRVIRIRELLVEVIKERRKLKVERNIMVGFLFGVVE